MQIIEQRKLIEELKYLKNKMTKEEQYQFEMFMKRNKDDEELDKISFNKLQDLYKKYVVKKSKADLEKYFKKGDS